VKTAKYNHRISISKWRKTSSFTKTAPIYFHWIYTMGVVSLIDLRARNQVVIDWKPSLLLSQLHWNMITIGNTLGSLPLVPGANYSSRRYPIKAVHCPSRVGLGCYHISQWSRTSSLGFLCIRHWKWNRMGTSPHLGWDLSENTILLMNNKTDSKIL